MLKPGNILDKKYEVIKTLGIGGMSTVYLCKNTRLENLWAIKEVPENSQIKIDLLAEPNILKKLNHSGIPKVIDIFNENSALYIVEDYIEGETLKDYVKLKGILSNEEIIDIASQLCTILHYLHSFTPPIIYRDLKPSNIIIKPDGRAVLIDFGIARTYKEQQSEDTLLLGSQGYIAPEQLMKVQSNVQTDIYSLGAVMYYLCTGKTPSSISELLSEEHYPKSLSPNIVSVIQKATAADVSKRFKSAIELSSELYSIDIYEKTTIMKNQPYTKEIPSVKTTTQNKKNKKPAFYIMTGLVLLLIIVYFVSRNLLNNNNKEASTPKSAVSSPKTEAMKVAPVQEKAEQKDIITRGILYKTNVEVISSQTNKPKGNGKNKRKEEATPLHLLYKLNPRASFTSTKFSVSLYNIEVIGDGTIAYLSIENKGSTPMSLDLSKTYLVDVEKDVTQCLIPVQSLTIPANTKYDEVKIYFKDLELRGSSFAIKTYFDKEASLYVDIK